MFLFQQIKIGAILEMSHPVLLKTSLQALLGPKWAPKAKASKVFLIIVINEVIDHDSFAWWAGFASRQVISGHYFVIVFNSYICYLYDRLWIPLSVCVQLSTLNFTVCVVCLVPHSILTFPDFNPYKLHIHYSSVFLTRVSVNCGFESHWIHKIF